MNNPVDLESAEREFNEATARLDGLKAHLFNIDDEIALVLHIKKNIEENIAVLKSRQIITIAIEYKKAKDDLDKIYNKLTMLRINKTNLGHSVDQAAKYLMDRREKYLHALESKVSKVIEVNFGRNDDRQDGDST